jgi:hypothetical protein
MPASFDSQQQQLRSEIGRSRRRLERRARQLVGGPGPLLAAAGRRSGGVLLPVALGCGYALASWVRRSRWWTEWTRNVVDPTLAGWFHRFVTPGACEPDQPVASEAVAPEEADEPQSPGATRQEQADE